MTQPPDRPLPADERPLDTTPIHTEDLPPTPTRDRNIVASAWIEAPAELLTLGDDLPAPDGPLVTAYKRRIGPWLLWRVGPAKGADARYFAVRADDLADPQLLTLLRHDADPFNRWEAAQRLALKRLLRAARSGHALQLDHAYLEAMRSLLRDPQLDAAFKAQALTLPEAAYIAEQLQSVDPQAIHGAVEAAWDQLAAELRADWEWAFEAHQVRGGYSPQARDAGCRQLANLALALLVRDATHKGESIWPGKAYQRVKDAGNMTERFGALAALVNAHAALADTALAQFHQQFAHEPLVIDKWFMLQARAPERDGKVFERARKLAQHPDFTLKNPNRARSLLVQLCNLNPGAFHRADAGGYVFWAEQVAAIDALNPQLAGRLARAMDRWAVLAEPYRAAAQEALKRLAERPSLSGDVREIVGKALGA